MLNWLGSAPVRKPLAWSAMAFVAAMTYMAMMKYGDVPPGLIEVIKWTLAVPLAVVGSSSYEHVKGAEKKDE